MSNENTLDYILGEALRAAEMRQGCTDYTPYVEALKRDIESHYKGLNREELREKIAKLFWNEKRIGCHSSFWSVSWNELKKMATNKPTTSDALHLEHCYKFADSILSLVGLREEALRKEGRQGIIDWFVKNSEFVISGADFYQGVALGKWQAQLKEWGIKEGKG